MLFHRFVQTGIILGACLCSGVAVAQDAGLDSGFTLFGGGRTGGEVEIEESSAAYKADDSASFGLIWNTEHSRNTEWEVYFSRQDTEFKLSDPLVVVPTIDLEMYTLQLGGTYIFDDRFISDSVQPYLAMTVGGTHVKSDADAGDSDTFFSGSIGLGLKFRPGERLGFRLEGRVHGLLVKESSKLFCSVGPEENVCAVEVKGDMLGQFEAFAGVTYRF